MTENHYRMVWAGAYGFPRPISAHVVPSPEGFTWTATDRYGVTETGTADDEHTARLRAEAVALRAEERPWMGHQLGEGRQRV